jgi:alpha-galactosidase
MRRFAFAAALALLAAVPRAASAGDAVWLTSLDLKPMTAGWGEAQVDRSCTQKPLTIAGKTFERGVGTHADSALTVDLKGAALAFSALVGVDGGAGNRGSVVFRVSGDGKELWTSGLMKGGQPAKEVRVVLRGVKILLLEADSGEDGIDYDHADWAEAKFDMEAGAKPVPVAPPPPPREEPVLLTPPPPREPRINGPRLTGCRPGHPFVYRVPCTGDRPMTFAATGLPASIRLDPQTGVLSGEAPKERGEIQVTLKAKNAHGAAERALTIVVGDTLALTPPMGWNDWYTFYERPTDALMRQAADIVVTSGMADVGYQYVNIDDCWMLRAGSKDPDLQGEARDAQGRINANRRFPDMKAMTDYIHARGLRAGIYTSPGPTTCAGFVGTHKHEEQDAKRFADWGFDFLKYDWCSYGNVATGDGLEKLQRPYRLMGDLLRKQDRDIVYNLCQYGMGEVWKWGGDVGGHCWRTTGDLGLERGSRLPGFYNIGFSNARCWEYAKPGLWNDPDYILIGYVGNAHNVNEPAKPTSLTPNEQYSYMAMWCLMAAPLFYSGDITRLDAFALNVLCNPEVIEVDQDALGKQARPVEKTARLFVLAKPMEDGSLAVGLFNLDGTEQAIAVTWEQLGLAGRQRVRDIWRQKDLGTFEGRFEAKVPRHGVSMVRMGAAK